MKSPPPSASARNRPPSSVTSSGCAARCCRRSSTSPPVPATHDRGRIPASRRSDMSLKERIIEDMKTAMRAKDAARLGAIRFLQAAIKQKEVDERVNADDTAILAI